MIFKTYFNLSKNILKRNKNLYIPYILTGIFIVVIAFFMDYFASSSFITKLRGGRTISSTFTFGFFTICIFSLIFLSYTNNFIIKNRFKELGVFSILGFMPKDLIFIELILTLINYFIIVFLGIIFGTLLSKLFFMFVNTSLDMGGTYSFELTPILLTAFAFSLIFLIILLLNLFKIIRFNPKKIIEQKSIGELTAKNSKFLTFLGIFLMLGGYIIANLNLNPLDSLPYFFLAVIMVIFGTFLLFSQGLIFFFKNLKKREDFFYKKKNFIYISQMIYRIKSNSKGLASICILLTMAIITIAFSLGLLNFKNQVMNRIDKDVTFTFVPNKNFNKEKTIKDLKNFLKENNIEILQEKISIKKVNYSKDGKKEIDGIFYEFNLKNKEDYKILRNLSSDFSKNILKGVELFSYSSKYEMNRAFFYQSGGLLYIGFLLSIIFFAASIMVMYYKQVSEGLEDKKNYDILRKVGMTKEEIKSGINSQVKSIFMLPLIVAICHSFGSLKIVNGIFNTIFDYSHLESGIYLKSLLIILFLSVLVYIFSYRLTSNVYYKNIREKI